MTQGTSFATPEGGDPAKTSDDPSFVEKPSEESESKLTNEQLEEIIKRDKHAQAHIKTLEQEAAERKARLEELEAEAQRYKAEIDKMGSFEELLEQKLQTPVNKEDKPVDQPAVNPDDVAAQVMERLQKAEAQKQYEANLASAMEEAKQRYGSDNFLKEVQNRANELGMSIDDVDKLAGSQPRVFKELFIGSTKDVPKRPSVSGQATVPNSTSVDSAEQRELYRQDRRKYFASQENFEKIAAGRNK